MIITLLLIALVSLAVMCILIWKEYRFSIEEYKYNIRRNIDGKMIGCTRRYYIVKRAFPFKNKKYLGFWQRGDLVEVKMYDSRLSGANEYTILEEAEERLRDVRANPERYYYDEHNPI